MSNLPFKDRQDAGQQLAQVMLHYQDAADVIILALPRGGVPVGHEIAQILHVPLDIIIVRKLGLPGQEEYAMGAIAGPGICILNPQALNQTYVSQELIQTVIAKENQELKRRNELYRQARKPPQLHLKQVILVDDGIATGSSIKAAIAVIKQMSPQSVIVATPVIPKDTIDELLSLVDELIYLAAPEPFGGVGNWYVNFPQVSDNEVISLLKNYSNEA